MGHMNLSTHKYSGKLLLLLIMILLGNIVHAQDKKPIKIGLALSGGGAKGLAHIGILKAIDSAGLKIDYISGTSMGAVIGSLYAIGYNGKEIEHIARTMDWDKMFSNKITLRALSMEEKDEYGKYAVEIPFENKKLNLPTGALESEELWIKLSELYFPVHRIKNFNEFSIPFVSIATDISNAEPVVQKRGEIITAIRASMAIPGVFTTVLDSGRALVDGGVIRNFPVSDVIEIGANYVIGSNVAEGLLPADKLTHPLLVLYQIASLIEKKGNKSQVAKSDLYIEQELDKFTAGSFEKSDEIIDVGIDKGKTLFPYFKKLADSLQSPNKIENKKIDRLPQIQYVYISDFEIIGLKTITQAAFLHSINFDNNTSYAPYHFAEMMRRAYGTREYNYIHYKLLPLTDGSAKIVFSVEERSPTYGKLALHYNTFSGISLITNASTRNFLTPNSRSLITFNLSENFRVKAEHLQYFGRGKHFELIPSIQYESFKVNSYSSLKKVGIYKLNYLLTDLKLQLANQRNYTTGLGIRYETEQFAPSLQSASEFNGHNRYITNFAFLHFNNLNQPVYPDKGIKLYNEIGWTMNQNSNNPNYSRAIFNFEFYKLINTKLNLFGLLQNGVNFSDQTNQFNGFYIGGLNKMYRNQIVFAGLQDITLRSQSVASAQLGLRWNLFSDLYLITRANVLVNEFLHKTRTNQNAQWFTGGALTVSYKTLLGPIEISGMYSGNSKQLQSYVNVGFSF